MINISYRDNYTRVEKMNTEPNMPKAPNCEQSFLCYIISERTLN